MCGLKFHIHILYVCSVGVGVYMCMLPEACSANSNTKSNKWWQYNRNRPPSLPLWQGVCVCVCMIMHGALPQMPDYLSACAWTLTGALQLSRLHTHTYTHQVELLEIHVFVCGLRAPTRLTSVWLHQRNGDREVG